MTKKARTKSRRKIEGLKWAKVRKTRPPWIPPTNHRKQSIKAGHGYEKKLADYMAARFGEDNVFHGMWIEYEDRKGKGWLQPDILVFTSHGESNPPMVNGEPNSVLKGTAIVLEAKLTYTKRSAYLKLKNFYLPVLTHIWPECQWKSMQTCCNLSSHAAGAHKVKDIGEVIEHCEGTPWFTNWCWRPKF